jgi:putative hydrolase of the HAD superfamily
LFTGVRAVFFDLDDTLCGYWDAAKGGLRAAFEAHPVPGKTTDEAIAAWAAEFRRYSEELKTSHWYEIYLNQGAVTRTEMMRQALEAMGVEDGGHAWRLSETYGEERNARLELFPEARNVLRALYGNFRLGLITNGPADVQRQEIATLGIGQYFDPVMIEGEMGIGKPHAAVFRRAEDLAGASGHEVVFVGNSYAHDIAPAIRAGWRTVWIRRASDVPPSAAQARREEIGADDPQPDATLGSLSDLPFLLGLGSLDPA